MGRFQKPMMITNKCGVADELNSPPGTVAGTPPIVFQILRIVLLCLAMMFAGFILRQTLRYGVQVPMEDEWSYVYNYQRYETGQISLVSTALSGAAEHLNGVQTGTILLWMLFGMNHRLIMILGWLQAVTLVVLMGLIARQALPRGSIVPSAILCTSSFFVFHPGAFQFWMWGIPQQYTLVPLFFLAAAFCAQLKLPLNVTILVSGLAATLASFTLGSGMLLWALLPVVLLARTPLRELLRHRIAIATYGLLGLVMTVLYIHNFLTYQNPSPPSTQPASLFNLASFFLAYNGNLVLGFPSAAPLSWEHGIGTILLIFVALSIAAAIKICHGKPEWGAIIVWLCLAAYEVLSASLVTLFRHTFGLHYLMEASRYVIATSFLPVATVAIALVTLRALRYRLPDNIRLYSVLLCTVTAFLAICMVVRAGQIPENLASFQSRSMSEHQGKVAVAAANLISLKEYRNIFEMWLGQDESPRFRELSNFITQKGERPTMWDADFIRQLAASPVNPQQTAGFVDRWAVQGGRLSLFGWAYLKERQEPAHGVIIIAIPPNGTAILLGVAFPSAERHDVADALQTPDALNTGWTAEIAGPLPESGTAIRCFAYDADSGKAYPLGGQKIL